MGRPLKFKLSDSTLTSDLNQTLSNLLSQTNKVNRRVDTIITRTAPASAALSLEELTDVSITSVQIGQTIIWNGTDWVNANLCTVAPAWWMSGDGTNYVWSTQLGRLSSGAANQVMFWMMRLPYMIKVTKLNLRVNGGQASTIAGYGMYDINGNKLFSWDSINTGVSNTTYSTTLTTPVLLLPGIYYGACACSSSLTPTTEGGYLAPSSSYTAWNSPSTARTGTAANPMVSGVLPATLGALTQNGLGSLPAVNMEA